MNRGHGSVPLRFGGGGGGDVVVKMRALQQQNYEIICNAKISTLLSVFVYMKICIIMR